MTRDYFRWRFAAASECWIAVFALACLSACWANWAHAAEVDPSVLEAEARRSGRRRAGQ